MIDDNFEGTKYFVIATLVVLFLSEILCETWSSNSIAKGLVSLMSSRGLLSILCTSQFNSCVKFLAQSIYFALFFWDHQAASCSLILLCWSVD